MSLACSAGGIVCFLLIFGAFVSVFVYLFGGLSVFVGQTLYVRKSQTPLRREAGHLDTKASKIARENKNPLHLHARDEIFRGTTQVLFAYKEVMLIR